MNHTPPRRAPRRQAGAMLIEVLVAIIICAFGLLGFAAMQARASVTEFESLQRGQALALVQDMANRIASNRANAADYLTKDLVGGGVVQDCSGLAGAAWDLCDWGNMLSGVTMARDGRNAGAMLAARGSISRAVDSAGALTTHAFVVCVVWQGMVATGAPLSACGAGDAAFKDDKLRRVAESTVCIAQLKDPAVPAAAPRC